VDWQHILYSVDDGVAHIVLNRPEKLNALGIGAGSNRQELVDALELADRDDEVGSILVSAAGRAFCAGGDLVGVAPAQNAYEHHLFIEQLAAANGRVRAIHKPIVAAVHGMCLGSGLGLLAQFDFVIAADDCRFGLIEGRIGHPGATEIVPIVGPAWAKFLMMTGEIISAARAEKIGLVLTTEPADALLTRCTELARRLARMPRESTVLNKATINGVADAMGRSVGKAVGRVHDVVTRDMSRFAKSPDGRLFDEILAEGGMDAMKQARDQQFKGPWLDK